MTGWLVDMAKPGDKITGAARESSAQAAPVLPPAQSAALFREEPVRRAALFLGR